MLAYLGGTDIDENDHVRSARAIKLSFIMESSTETLRKASRTLSQVKASLIKPTPLLNITYFFKPILKSHFRYLEYRPN